MHGKPVKKNEIYIWVGNKVTIERISEHKVEKKCHVIGSFVFAHWLRREKINRTEA